jgi:hypothetical protein
MLQHGGLPVGEVVLDRTVIGIGPRLEPTRDRRVRRAPSAGVRAPARYTYQVRGRFPRSRTRDPAPTRPREHLVRPAQLNGGAGVRGAPGTLRRDARARVRHEARGRS